jgi:hypothetical protein
MQGREDFLVGLLRNARRRTTEKSIINNDTGAWEIILWIALLVSLGWEKSRESGANPFLLKAIHHNHFY